MSAVEETVRPDEEAVAEVLPILPLKETVVFPDSMTPLAVGQERSIQLVDEAVANDSTIALVTTRNSGDEATSADDIYDVGTAALIHKMIRVPDGTLRILVQGVRRVRMDRLVQTEPYLVGEFSDLPDIEGPETEVEALARNVETLFSRIIGLVPYLPDELQLAAANAEDPSALANLIATTMRLKTPEKQELLEEADIEARLRKLTVILNRELEVLELGTKIQSQVQSELEKGQREFFLRQQLKAIQGELGEGNELAEEVQGFREKAHKAKMPKAT
ncbi:MAG TPA: LON peptidase substrate-binding domain-containing protein, partial [Gaiellaceae bacterium]|nr:LON peptidase substrate-binding domain-containing protein [Gaiellaceae bacterium]